MRTGIFNNSNEIGDWRDVLIELPKKIHHWMPKLAKEGIVGADAIFSCLGPALEIFSRYTSVEKASGEQVGLKEFLEQKEQQLLNTSYVGKVVDNNDPRQLGRCRIRVYGVYGNKIPDDELPWALPEFSFIGSKLGSFIVPPTGCIVSVYFDNGELSKPVYTKKVVKVGSQPTDKNKNRKYPDNLIFFVKNN